MNCVAPEDVAEGDTGTQGQAEKDEPTTVRPDRFLDLMLRVRRLRHVGSSSQLAENLRTIRDASRMSTLQAVGRTRRPRTETGRIRRRDRDPCQTKRNCFIADR